MSNQATSKEATRVRPGDVLAEKYVVERVLAEGGMGVVVAAKHTQLGRRVALKFLLPELCEKQEVVARFLREAQSMTTIQNEHVARVLDVGTTTEGAPYMVMEYLEGEDLSQMLERRGPIPVDEAVEFVLQGMEAVAEAHLHGIVHRDLKPSNLFVTQRPDGSPLVKVLDFGISKVATEGAAADLTQAQGLLGSPLYMAPEQIRSSKSVDVRADVWALGIILYELMSGHTPFDDAETIQAVLAAIVADDAPALQSVRPDVPAGLSEIVGRCLKRPRDERFADVGELATALHPYATREGRLSIERIERVAAHSKRQSNLELRAPSSVTPSPGSRAAPGSAPPSPLAATAVDRASREPTPVPLSPRLARLDVDDESPVRSVNTPSPLSRSHPSDGAATARRARSVIVMASALLVVVVVVAVGLLRGRGPGASSTSDLASSADSARVAAPSVAVAASEAPTVADTAIAAPLASTAPAPSASPSASSATSGVRSTHLAHRSPRTPVVAASGASSAAAPPAPAASSPRKKRELDDSPYDTK